LDADDIALPNRIATQIKYMSNHPSTDLLFSAAEYIDEYGSKIGLFTPYSKYFTDINRYFFSTHLLNHPTMMCKSQVLKFLGYDEVFIRSQDYEFWMRALAIGYKFAYIQEPLIQYRLTRNDTVKRLQKELLWNKYTLKAHQKNIKAFKTNVYFWKKTVKVALVFFLLLIIPHKLLLYILQYKK
jgi:hypothetical protein